MNHQYIIIVAGGKGLRMESDVPKQFIPVAGLPVLMHTIQRFKAAISDLNVVLVLPENQQEYWQKLCLQYDFKVPHSIANGGETRFHSVKSGLALITSEGIVGVHDAVRPLVSEETIQKCYEMAKEKGNAIPVIPINESIRKVSTEGNKMVNRAEYVAVQTPQVFQIVVLKKAFLQDYSPNFTDDASVLESMGECINLVQGNSENIKITLPSDLKIAEILLNRDSKN